MLFLEYRRQLQGKLANLLLVQQTLFLLEFAYSLDLSSIIYKRMVFERKVGVAESVTLFKGWFTNKTEFLVLPSFQLPIPHYPLGNAAKFTATSQEQPNSK